MKPTAVILLAALATGCPRTTPSDVSIDGVEVSGDVSSLDFTLLMAGRGFLTRALVYDVRRREGRSDLTGLSLEIFDRAGLVVTVPGQALALETPGQMRARVNLAMPLTAGTHGVRLRKAADVLAELDAAFVVPASTLDGGLEKDAGASDAELDAELSEDAGAADTEPSDAEPADVEPADADPIDAAPLDADPEDGGLLDAEPDDLGPPADSGTFADFVPSNIPPPLLVAGTDPFLLVSSDGVVVIDTDTGAITRDSDGADLRAPGVVFNSVAQPGAPTLGVFSASSVIVQAGVTVEVRGASALVLASAFEVTIDGSLDARGGQGAPTLAGSGGFAGGDAATVDGFGPGGGQGAGGGADTGGGGGGHSDDGGDGGARGMIAGGAGGGSYGAAALVPLVGGSGGGPGGGTPVTWGRGGGGGGAVQISARGPILIGGSGGINCGGGGGEAGASDDGGGGGGSGGAILIESPSILLLGHLTANGGGGGAGANGAAAGDDGQDGGPNANRAQGGEGNADGSAGGAGGAGNTPDGLDGVTTTGVGADDNAGGGGGAGGRLRLRGEVITTGVISPSGSLTVAPL